ncbi:MAG: hypothetical protein OXC38_02800 [Gammaproteobacteria bacterium]|nr:hypothetical protein [Gammaproteobacteria bacterium]
MLASLSTLIDQALRTDAEAQKRLQAMGQRTIRLELFPLPAIGLRTADGQLAVESPAEPADLAVSGHLVAFVRYVLSGRADGIRLEGEGEIAQDFRDFLATLDIDWEELLSRAVGDVPARLMMRTVEECRQVARNFSTAAESNTRDYLHEESGLLPNASDLDRFVREVDRLRDDLERFELRLDRIRP